MRDTTKEQCPSYPTTESNFTEHCRASLGTINNRSKAGDSQDVNKVHRRREISPPPLKRQRTAYEESHRGQDSVSLPTLGTSNSLHRQPIDVRSNRKPFARPLQTLDSLQAPHSHHAHEAQSRSVSSLRKIFGFYRQSSKSESCKPACLVCDKTTATSYNPVIACPGCARPYHDSCRRPALPQGVDPQHWRCSACSNRDGKPANPMLSSKSVPARSSVVRDIVKPTHARNPIVDSARLSNGTDLGKNVHAQTFRTSTTSAGWLGSLERPKEDFKLSLQSGRSENPSTPARCSNQSLHLELSSSQHHIQAQSGLSAPSSPVRAQNRTPIAPCSGRQASFIVRPEDEHSQYRSRRNESHVEEVRRLEIPETPNATTPYDILPLTSSAEPANSPIAHSPVAGAGRSSWIDLNRTCTLDHTSREPPHNEQHREKDHGKPDASKTIQESNAQASGSPIIHEPEEIQTHLSLRRSPMLSSNDATVRISYSEQTELRATTLESSPKTVSLSVPLNLPTSPEVNDASSHMHQRRHTNRELARIALACANGSSMSAPQIIDWLVRRFPYLQQGQALWKENLKANLSLREFRSNRAMGLDDVHVVYSFANETYKTRYEVEYRDYITHYSHGDAQPRVSRLAPVEPTGDVHETIESVPEQHHRRHLGEAVDNTPTRDVKDTWGNTPKHVASSQQSAASFIPSPVSINSDNSTSPHAFKLSKLSPARNKTEHAPEIKRETSFHKAFPPSTRTSLEMMTAEEKARRVVEIRARPSRKQLIDSGQRLAHIRRYRRQDPHDESDGAWKPQSVEAKENPIEDAEEDCDELRSIREVFRLPDNAVPMLHEGNELAFRDGTMVNGRLPRPRRIYKVGKRLGAGLTVN